MSMIDPQRRGRSAALRRHPRILVAGGWTEVLGREWPSSVPGAWYRLQRRGSDDDPEHHDAVQVVALDADDDAPLYLGPSSPACAACALDELHTVDVHAHAVARAAGGPAPARTRAVVLPPDPHPGGPTVRLPARPRLGGDREIVCYEERGGGSRWLRLDRLRGRPPAPGEPGPRQVLIELDCAGPDDATPLYDGPEDEACCCCHVGQPHSEAAHPVPWR